MSPLRLVLLHDIDKLSAASAERLKSLWTKIPPSSILVMSSLKYDKKSKLYSDFIAKKGEPDKIHLFEFSEYEPAATLRLLSNFAESRGKHIAAETSSAMMGLFGHDIFRLENEIEKLCLYAGDKLTLEKKDMALSSGFSKVETVNDLPELIFSSALDEALSLVRRGVSSGISEMQMLFILRNSVFGLNAAKNLTNYQELLRQFAYKKEVLDKYQRFSRQVNQLAINQQVMLVFQAEYALKSARFPADAVIEALVISLSRALKGNN